MASLENERACVVRVQFLRLPGLKIQFVCPLRTFSLLVLLLGLSKLCAGAPEDLSPEERARIAENGSSWPYREVTYEQGVALNKAIALYGLKTLRRYSAVVVSIKPAAAGSGAEIELRADTFLTHRSNSPWDYVGERRPVPPRTLHWHWPDGHAFPFCIGYRLDAYANVNDQVQRASSGTICDECSIIAMRTSSKGFREICLGCYINNKKTYFLLQPDHLNIDESIEIEWNVKHGLSIGHFTTPYGGEFVFEGEAGGKNWLGWPLINVPGKYVRPGRDGWQAYRSHKLGIIPAKQYLAYPAWDVMHSGPP